MTPSGCPVTPGFPIRKSPDQSSFDSSPRHIAAYHVLRRLSTPRHPPCTLSNLTALMRGCHRPHGPNDEWRMANAEKKHQHGALRHASSGGRPVAASSCNQATFQRSWFLRLHRRGAHVGKRSTTQTSGTYDSIRLETRRLSNHVRTRSVPENSSGRPLPTDLRPLLQLSKSCRLNLCSRPLGSIQRRTAYAIIRFFGVNSATLDFPGRFPIWPGPAAIVIISPYEI